MPPYKGLIMYLLEWRRYTMMFVFDTVGVGEWNSQDKYLCFVKNGSFLSLGSIFATFVNDGKGIA
jgi:hypothetical protein